MHVANVVVPIFLVIALGYAFRAWGVVKPSWVRALNSFVYYVALPAIIVTSISRVDWGDGEALSLVAANMLLIAAFAAALLLALGALPVSGKDKASAFMVVVAGNTVYMGFPIVERAVGPGAYSVAIAAASAHLVLGLALSTVAAKYFSGDRKGLRSYASDFLLNPPMLALAAGVALSFTGFGPASDALGSTLRMLEATASPLALFALGSFMHGKFSHARRVPAAFAALARVAAFPAFFLYAGPAIGVAEGEALLSSVLIASMPTAVTAFVIAERHKLDTALIANAILIGTALSAVSIPVFLWLAS